MKTLSPLFLMVNLILMVSLACSFRSSATPTQKPTVTDQPATAVNTPTAEPSTDAQEFYTETFDGNLDNYTYFSTGKGREDKMKLETKDGSLIFDLKDKNLWIYVTYNPFVYKDVAINVTADNRGKNNNNVSLICRYNKDQGWYEFTIANNGLYWIYAYDTTGTVLKGYNKIAEGISKAVKQGKDVNNYSASCIDEKLSLIINGTEVKTIKDTKYRFSEGKVGFSVSSFNTVPILVNVDSFTISEP